MVHRLKIAIIGSGISGLTAAYFLSRKHDVTVYEKNDYIGGHTATKCIDIQGRSYQVDTGFIVYNDWTYPQFIKLLNELRIKTRPTEMGFSVTSRISNLEYCGRSLNSLFSDRMNLLRPSFLRMIRDIVRFNKKAKLDFSLQKITPGLSLIQYLQQGQYGEEFIHGYILPMASAIWSSSVQVTENFEALFFVRFFINHGLLNISDRPQWRVIDGGSQSYISKLVRPFKDSVYKDTAVSRVSRHSNHIQVDSKLGSHKFDQVVFATHSNQALSLLEKPNSLEKELLSSIPYSSNSVVLHTDQSLLPKKPRAWASWNFLIQKTNSAPPILTYNMNILQGLTCPETMCVTVNGEEHIDPKKILRKFNYSHPQFSCSSVSAQQKWGLINGQNRTWFCGAYWGNGFHEDGVVSGRRVAEKLGATLNV